MTDRVVRLQLTLQGTAKLRCKVAAPFAFPPAVNGGSWGSTSSPALGGVGVQILAVLTGVSWLLL